MTNQERIREFKFLVKLTMESPTVLELITKWYEMYPENGAMPAMILADHKDPLLQSHRLVVRETLAKVQSNFR